MMAALPTAVATGLPSQIQLDRCYSSCCMGRDKNSCILICITIACWLTQKCICEVLDLQPVFGWVPRPLDAKHRPTEDKINKWDTAFHSFIHSGHFYSAPSSPLPLRGAPDYSTDTVSEFHAEAHRQLQVKNLPKVPT